MTDETTKAPDRVTPEMLEQAVAGQYFFNLGANALPDNVPEWQRESLGLLTLCILVLQNGWTIVGKSACVSPAVFDAEVGNKLAREDALRQIWPLEGYVLKTYHQMEAYQRQVEAEAAAPAPAPEA